MTRRYGALLLGITGKKGSGKNSVADFLVEEAVKQDIVVVQRGFADTLKLSVCRLFHPSCTMAEAIEWADALKSQTLGSVTMFMPQNARQVPEQIKITGRQLLQRYGTEAHRDVFGESFWTDQLLPRGFVDDLDRPAWEAEWQFAHGLDETIDIAVITDVRFENETERVRGLGGRVVLVERPGINDGDAHASEVDLPAELIDEVLLNDSTLDALRDRSSELLGTLVHGRTV